MSCGSQACPGWQLYYSRTVRLELPKQAGAAVESMHSQSVVHRDLTSYNLRITNKWDAKVGTRCLSCVSSCWRKFLQGEKGN